MSDWERRVPSWWNRPAGPDDLALDLQRHGNAGGAAPDPVHLEVELRDDGTPAGIPDVDHAPRLGHQRLPALVRVHIEGIRERPLHFFRAEPDNVLDFQQVLFAVDEKDDDPFGVEDPLHFLDELVEDLFPTGWAIQGAR